VAEDRPHIIGGGPDFHLAGGVLTVDLSALIENYRELARLSAPATTAAVVKADAYGLGVLQIVPALSEAGCTRFFVALPHEGIAVRRVAPDAEIFVFSGPLSTETGAVFRGYRLIPVLNSLRDVAIWEAEGWDGVAQLPAALHVDTGMNRLGLTPAEAAHFLEDNALTRAVRIVLLMSHLACADEPEHPLNRRQLDAFQKVRALFPGIESSLANSAGVLLGGGFLCDLTRPGIALYGGAPSLGAPNPMRPVVTAKAHVLQVRRAKAGETVGYGAAVWLRRDSLIVVAAVGYADGYHRAGSGAGVPLRKAELQGAAGFIGGRRVPILGRISMDLTAFDVTELGEDAVRAGDLIELFGPNIPLDEAARAAGTISYELLTSLGRRYHRIYVSGDAAA
jgi:alanine racemase